MAYVEKIIGSYTTIGLLILYLASLKSFWHKGKCIYQFIAKQRRNAYVAGNEY